MVQSLMYCAEQIVIPEHFPSILKVFAKAVIRTQPYDLLRWSAAYFRCLAMNVPPPVKPRLELDSHFGCLTRGYLRVLLEQIGKGYYVQRDILFDKWKGLCLPEEDLLKFLSLCRMFNWTHIHWLKLFAVMVGSLNKSVRCTVIMLCELLTDDLEGGPAPVPMWMFRDCYYFIAHLDCSKEQQFDTGRKILENGDLEEPVQMPETPRILSTTAFRDNILNEWRKTETSGENPDNLNELITTCECNKIPCDCDSESETVSSKSATSSNINSDFKFVGDYKDPYQVLKKSPDFDSIIVLLNEMQGNELHKYNTPADEIEKKMKQALLREKDLIKQREKMAEECEKDTQKHLLEERVDMLQEMGPPWSWMYQFMTHNSCDRSYNYMEYMSIASDITPPLSNDGSFDFETQEYKGTLASRKKSTEFSNIDEHIDTIQPDTNEVEHKKCEEQKTNVPVEGDKEDEEEFAKSNLMQVMDRLEEAKSDGEINLTDTSSIRAFVHKEEKSVLDRAGERVNIIDYGPLKLFLDKAEKEGLEFNNLDELFEYFKEQYQDIDMTEPIVKYNVFTKTLLEDTAKIDAVLGKFDDKVRDELPEMPEPTVSDTVVNKATVPAPPAQEETVSQEIIVDQEMSNIVENIFGESGIDIDEKKLSKKPIEPMIIGVVDKPKVEPPPPKTPDAVESDIFTTTDETSSTLLSDISSKEQQSCDNPEPSCEDTRIPLCTRKPKIVEHIDENPEEPFFCIIPPMLGIGPTVNPRTVMNFLTYLKGRSLSQKGLVFPRNFKEDQCPNMIDCLEG